MYTSFDPANSWSKKPKLLETVKIPSNLRRSSHRMVYPLEFSNVANDPIDVDKMGNLSESSEQWSALGKKKSSNDEDRKRNKDSKDFNYISTKLGSKMAKDSLDERTTTISED